ncbi:MAG TPA: hypothetical protein VHD32_12835 [Candidatus Didemnitutus sp.]|nr:hypothetical protein [Candidatus Didemnitutus sp.]
MPPALGGNWEMFAEEHLAHGPSEIDLRRMLPGDRIQVATRNTRYTLEWRDDGSVLLSSDRSDRPWGPVTILGCVFRRSKALARGVLFCGGSMEYDSTEGKVRHRTTPITALTHEASDKLEALSDKAES